MYISCGAGRDDIHFAFLFVTFPFSGGIGKRISPGYDRKVSEYTELQVYRVHNWLFFQFF